MILVIDPQGSIHCLYDEAIDLHALGQPVITRASHVEPDSEGRWWANLAPVGGPKLGPFIKRTEALAAERDWLEQWLASGGSMRQQILCWTDGHFFWHDGCVSVSESDCELRAVFENDAVPADAACDTCGGLAAEPREVVHDPGR